MINTTPATKYDSAEDAAAAKVRRNAEYLAKLDESFKQLEDGKIFVTSIEALEALTNGR
jgi:hypothetical protein